MIDENNDILNGYYKKTIYTFLSPHPRSWIIFFHRGCHDAFWGRFWNRALVSGSIRLSEDSHLSQPPTWCQTAPPLPSFLCSCGLCSDVISHWCSRKHICVLTQTLLLSWVTSCPQTPSLSLSFGLNVHWLDNGLIGKQPVVQLCSSVRLAFLKNTWFEEVVMCPKQ